MEEDREIKHSCKFCDKSFPCGRSLGGHMRSHLISVPDESNEKLMKKKLPSLKYGCNRNDASKEAAGAGQNAYSLRENRKKTSKFANLSEDNSLDHSKICKECGKGFQSWKALFGHMKCHSDKVSHNTVVEDDDDSWDFAAANHKLIRDSQSDNDAAAPIRKQRSRTLKRYKADTNGTTPLTTISNASRCVSAIEIEHEQEEVAMSLIMLSRDLSNWDGLKSVGGDSSDNNSEFLEARSSSQTNQASKTESKNNLKKSCINLDSESFKSKRKQPESSKVSGISRKEFRLKNSQVPPTDAFLGNNDFIVQKTKVELEGNDQFQQSKLELAKSLSKESNHSELESSKQNSSKRKCIALHDPELSSADYSMKMAYGASDSELLYLGSDRKSKFECTTCNKTFHSYQALGGHRASHKKMKGCFASKIDCSENSSETEISPNQTADSKLIKKSFSNDSTIDGSKAKVEMTDYVSKEISMMDTDYCFKKNKVHECPICFKVFPSGQALGGHKRSHLIAEAKSNQTIVIQKEIPEIRDFLDLNLPAPVEEESSSDKVYFNTWWMASNLKQEPLVGML